MHRYLHLKRPSILWLLVALLLAACSQTADLETEPPPSPTEARFQATTETATVQPPTPTPLAATATATRAPTGTPATTPTAASTATPSAWPIPSSLPLPMREELSFEVVAHEGGHVQSVAAVGNIAYVGIGPRLVMLDATNPTNVQLIARSPVLPGLVRAVLPQENTVYAAAGQHLVALELGDREFNIVAQVELPGGISHLLRVDDLLYAAGTVPVGPDEQPSGFLAVVSPTATGELALVDTPTLPGAVRGVAQMDDLLYMALDGKWRDSYIAFDLTSGPLLDEPSTLAIPVSEEVHSLQVVGDTLLIGGYMAFYAVDIGTSSDTGSIRGELLWEIEASPDLFLPMVEGMAVVGDTIYTVGNMPAGAYIPSRLAVPAPEPFTGTPSPSTSPLVALSNTRLFVAEGTSLEMYDASQRQPGELLSIGGYDPFIDVIRTLGIDESSASGNTLFLYGDELLSSSQGELITFSLPDLQRLANLAIEANENEVLLNQGAQFDLLLHGEEAYVVAADGIHQINVSNPAAPQPTAHYPFAADPLDPRGLVAAGDTLYLGLHRDPHIAAITFEGGSAQQVDQLGPLQGKNLQRIAATDDTLYVTTSDYEDNGWLHTIDVSGNEMERLATMPLPGEPVWALATDGALLATAVQNQLILINVANPNQPELVANVNLPTTAADTARYVYDLAFHDELLFVITSSYLLPIELTDPASPRAIGGFQLPSSAFNLGDLVAFSGDTAVVGSGPMGILVLQMVR